MTDVKRFYGILVLFGLLLLNLQLPEPEHPVSVIPWAPATAGG